MKIFQEYLESVQAMNEGVDPTALLVGAGVLSSLVGFFGLNGIFNALGIANVFDEIKYVHQKAKARKFKDNKELMNALDQKIDNAISGETNPKAATFLRGLKTKIHNAVDKNDVDALIEYLNSQKIRGLK